MDAAMRARLGAFVRKQRELSGLSQLDCMRAMWPGSTKNAYMYRLESGQLDPRVSTLIRLAKVLQLEPSELLKFADSDDTADVTCPGLT